MASPFKVFRKNQKLMLALLGVLVMLGFVVLPVIMQGMGYQKITNPRVLSTDDYGDLKQSNLSNLRSQRQVTLRFLETLGMEIVRAGGSPMAVQNVQQAIARGDLTYATSDEALVETWLLARRAEQLGLVVDDQAINAFLADLMQGLFESEQVHSILRAIRVSENQLFAVLEWELLALRLREMFAVSINGMTPAQRWDYFQRLNRRVTIESFPVRVSDFLESIPDPKDKSTVLDFYDQHKAQPYDPRSPDPGFREPQKVAVEYLKAEYERFVDLDAVTDEEIKTYYEENKDRLYKQEELPALDEEAPPEEESKPEAGQEEPTRTDSSSDEKASTSDADRETAPEASPPAEQSAPEGQPPTETEPGEKAAPPSAESDGTSSNEAATRFRLVSLVEENAESSDAAGAEEAASGPEAPSEAAPATEEQAPTAAPSEEPAPETAAPEPPPVETAAPAEAPQSQTPPPAEKAAADAPSSQEPASEGSQEPTGDSKPETDSQEPEAETQEEVAGPPRYIPLEKVEDEIRRQLAREKAPEKIRKVLNDIQTSLVRYHDQLIRFQVDQDSAKGAENLTPPEKPDFRKLASEHGLIARSTGLISALEAQRLDIGSSQIGENPFLYTVFERSPKHRPAISQDAKGDSYLFWKVDEVDQRIPELEEPGVRDRVLRQWKMIQARTLAEQEAKRLAGEANKAGKPLGEVFADRPEFQVAESEPFSWLTYGGVHPLLAQGRPPRLGEVNGADVEVPGNDFMQAVFGLKKGEVGTAPNQPKTVYYVVRVADSNPLPEVLWRMFLAEGYFAYFGAAAYDRSSLQEAWLDGIKSQVGFQWDPEWQRESWRRRR